MIFSILKQLRHLGQQATQEFPEQVVIGLHGALVDWMGRAASGNLTAAERARATQHYPTILSLVESVFPPARA